MKKLLKKLNFFLKKLKKKLQKILKNLFKKIFKKFKKFSIKFSSILFFISFYLPNSFPRNSSPNLIPNSAIWLISMFDKLVNDTHLTNYFTFSYLTRECTKENKNIKEKNLLKSFQFNFKPQKWNFYFSLQFFAQFLLWIR